MKKDVVILKEGGLAIRVCTNAKHKKAIEALTNQASWCGTEHGWVVDEAESKRLGQSKVTCADDPKRIHIILYA